MLRSCGRNSLERYSRSRCHELPEDPSHVLWGNHDIALISSAALSLPCIPIAMTAKRPPLNPGPWASDRNGISCRGVPSLFQHRQRCHPVTGNTPAPDTKHQEMCLSYRLAEGKSRTTVPKESLGILMPSARGISGGPLQAWVWSILTCL